MKLMLVAPYVGAWIETLSFGIIVHRVKSHPTWVRGLKPVIMYGIKTVMSVAPYVGAWIETEILTGAEQPPISRTLRGCVDWNFRRKRTFVNANKSHPTWVRGLKQRHGAQENLRIESHPTWVRGLKQSGFHHYFWSWIVAPYVGAWIEASSLTGVGTSRMSHPTWVRGLKH